MESKYDLDPNQSCKPSVELYNSVLKMYNRSIPVFNQGQKNQKVNGTSKERLAVEKIESILRHMIAYGERNISAAPNTETYNIAISSFAECGDARAAEELLNEMIESESEVVQPNVISYNTAIEGWSRSQEHGAADRADHILNMMEKVDNWKNLAPTSTSFIGVISAYCRCRASKSGERAQDVLERFERSGLQVESYVYNTVLDCHAKSGRKDSIDKVEALLERMVTLDVANRYDSVFANVLSLC